MAVKDRATLSSDVASLFADNATGDISEADLRSQSLDEIDSQFNLTDDDSDDIAEGASNLFLTTAERTKVAHDWTSSVLTEGVNYTGGVTTVLTLPVASPGDNEGNVRVLFQGVPQQSDQWSISGTTLTLTSPIPIGVDTIELLVLGT